MVYLNASFSSDPDSKVYKAKPKAFVGTRDAKDRRLLGYGKVLYVRAPFDDQVTMATMYLSGDAQLW